MYKYATIIVLIKEFRLETLYQMYYNESTITYLVDIHGILMENTISNVKLDNWTSHRLPCDKLGLLFTKDGNEAN